MSKTKFNKGDLVYRFNSSAVLEVVECFENVMLAKQYLRLDEVYFEKIPFWLSKSCLSISASVSPYTKVDLFTKPKFTFKEKAYDAKLKYLGTIVAMKLYYNLHSKIFHYEYLLETPNGKLSLWTKEFFLFKKLNYNQYWAKLNE